MKRTFKGKRVTRTFKGNKRAWRVLYCEKTGKFLRI
nr:MAG TPA: hypothetical protein [Caudoviricetes sp.]